MQKTNDISCTASDKIQLAKKCLTLIASIADRGARSENSELIGYALQELTQVLLERTGTEDRLLEPVPAEKIDGLHLLYEELEFVEAGSEGLAARSVC